MVSRRLKLLSVTSLAMLALLCTAWVGSYVKGAADAFDQAQAGLEARMNSVPPTPAVTQRVPYRWIRCWSSRRSTWFLIGSKGSLQIARYSATPTQTAVGDPELKLPGRVTVTAAQTSTHVGRSYQSFGYREAFMRSSLGWNLGLRSFAVPFWMLCLPTLIFPALWVRATLRARSAIRRGLCIHCGYDLRATPDRCPECGTINLTHAPPSLRGATDRFSR